MRRHAVLTKSSLPEQDTCPTIQQFIEQLAVKHRVDVAAAGVRLWLALPGTPERLLIAGLTDQRIGITHCVADADEQLVCDTDLVLLIEEVGWQPVELLHTDAVWAAYVQVMVAMVGVQIFDEAGEIRLPRFAEYWAEQLTQQHWLEESQPVYV